MCLEIAVLTIHSHLAGPQEAENAIGDGEIRGLDHLGFLHLPQTMLLGVIGVHYQQCLQCHPDLITQTDQRNSKWGRWHWEEAHMKINLPIFKDKDAKDAVTYESWRWDLTVYQHAGCRDCTLLPYTIRSLQGYPGELVQSSGTDITLDDVLTIFDEHYNNVKVLDALNQELFQLWMADKETVLDLGICLSRHLQILAASFPRLLSPRSCSRAEERSLLWQTSQAIEGDGSLPEGWDHRWEHIQITIGLPGRLRKKIQWSCLEVPESKLLTVCLNQGLLASSPWGNLRVIRHFPGSPQYVWHS